MAECPRNFGCGLSVPPGCSLSAAPPRSVSCRRKGRRPPIHHIGACIVVRGDLIGFRRLVSIRDEEGLYIQMDYIYKVPKGGMENGCLPL